jgi:hypothetical protein
LAVAERCPATTSEDLVYLDVRIELAGHVRDHLAVTLERTPLDAQHSDAVITCLVNKTL